MASAETPSNTKGATLAILLYKALMGWALKLLVAFTAVGRW